MCLPRVKMINQVFLVAAAVVQTRGRRKSRLILFREITRIALGEGKNLLFLVRKSIVTLFHVFIVNLPHLKLVLRS